MVRFNPSLNETGGEKPVSNMDVSYTVDNVNFLIRSELIGYDFPVILLARSKKIPIKKPSEYGILSQLLEFFPINNLDLLINSFIE